MTSTLGAVQDIWRRSPPAVAVSLAVGFVAALAEIVAIALLFPVLMLFTGASPGAGVGARLANAVSTLWGGRPSLAGVLVVVVGLTTLRSAAQYLARVVTKRYELRVNLGLKREFLRAFTSARWDFVIRSRTGSLLNTFAQHTVAASVALPWSVELATDATACLVYLAFASYQSPILAAFVVTAGAVMGPVLKRVYWKVRAIIGQRLEMQNRLADKFLEYLAGFKTFKSMALERLYLRELECDLDAYAANELRSHRLQAALNAVGEPVFAGITAAFLLVAHYGFAVGLETVVIFFALLTKTNGRLNNLQINAGRLVQAVPAIRACREVTDAAGAAAERTVTRRPGGPIATIEFERAGFTYPDGTAVLRDVTFRLRLDRGLVGIAGVSGAGKSTLLDLLAGLLVPTTGSVRINGVDTRELDLATLRAGVGFVPQSPVLFARSIRENISLREPDETAAGRVEEAARLADAHDFIARLARGYDTVMGEEGASLSLGQVQRISIARALYQRPEVLFFDEPTSALDARAAAGVWGVIERVAQRYPVFVVSHGPDVRRLARTLVVVEGGGVSVTEQGPVGAGATGGA